MHHASTSKKFPARLWDQTSFHLHWLLALTVLIQVGLILFRKIVGHHSAWSIYRGITIQIHIYLGLFIFLLALIFLIRKIFLSGNTSWEKLFPIKKADRKLVLEDLKILFTLKIPVRSLGGGLAGLIQGLGVLLVFGLAGIGTLAFISWTFPVLNITSWGGPLIETHKFFAVLIWWYLGGHIGMTCLHKILPQKFQVAL